MSCGSATSPEASCNAVDADWSRAAWRTPVISSKASATAQAIATVIGNHCTRWVRDRRAIRYSTARIRTLGLEADPDAAALGLVVTERAGVIAAATHRRQGGAIKNARGTRFHHLRLVRAALAVEQELDHDVAGLPGLQGLRRVRGAQWLDRLGGQELRLHGRASTDRRRSRRRGRGRRRPLAGRVNVRLQLAAGAGELIAAAVVGGSAQQLLRQLELRGAAGALCARQKCELQLVLHAERQRALGVQLHQRLGQLAPILAGGLEQRASADRGARPGAERVELRRGVV